MSALSIFRTVEQFADQQRLQKPPPQASAVDAYAAQIEKMLSGLVLAEPVAVTAAELMPALKPPAPEALAHAPADPRIEAHMAEYAALSAELGIAAPELAVDEFRRFLTAHDLPVYSLNEVVAYMDDKAARESRTKAGWQWVPLRDKDNEAMQNTPDFGRRHFSGNPFAPALASDFYAPRIDLSIMPRLYTRTVPLHALKRIALIEREFKKPVAFMVSDYAPAPAFKADPFLLAVVPNPHVADGVGRFVIDFWDEPGFGIDKMLAP